MIQDHWFSKFLWGRYVLLLFQDPSDRQTKFLALDKCLPSRDYLQFLDMEPDPSPAAFSEEGQVIGGDGDDAPIIISNLYPEPQEDVETVGAKSEVEVGDDGKAKLFIDPEWLCILQSTNEFFSLTQIPCILPGQDGKPPYVPTCFFIMINDFLLIHISG